jgi:hypothetical protein
MTEDTPSRLGNVVTIDDVRGSVEETLNALLDAEADRLCNAERYERSEARRDRRAGHYERKLQTKAGEVKLRIPKLRAQTFETGDHRALPAPRELGRGGFDRDVSGRRPRFAGSRTSPKPCGARECRHRRYRS